MTGNPNRRLGAKDIRDRLADRAADLAQHLLGEANAAMSSPAELRFGNKGSLAVIVAGKKAGSFFDHEIEKGGDLLDLIQRERNCSFTDALDFARDFVGGTRTAPAKASGKAAPAGRIVATYDYCDEGGALLFQVCRYDPKDFRQRKPNGRGWIWNVKGVKRVPYRLPDLIKSNDKVVFVVEGERDVDNLWKIGVPATCNAGGAGKWHPELSKFFDGRDVVVIPDRDPQKVHPKTKEPMFHPDGKPMLPGQDHAQAVASALHGIAKRVRVLELWKSWPDMPLKGDVSDWLDQGGTAEQLYALIAGTAPPPPEAVTEPDLELDEAIGVLGDASHQHVIETAFSSHHADYLRLLRRAQQPLKAADIKPWRDQHRELVRRQCIKVESREPLVIVINRKRVIALAADQNRRLREWAGVAPDAGPGATPAAPPPPRVLNVKDTGKPLPPNCVYVGRLRGWGPTKWGNTHSKPRNHTPEEHAKVVAEYRVWIVTQPDRMAELHELGGKDLVCHCAPLPCHADVLLELANAPPSPREDMTEIDKLIAARAPGWTGAVAGTQKEVDAATEQLRDDGATGHWLVLAPRERVVVDHDVIQWLLLLLPAAPVHIEWIFALCGAAVSARCPIWVSENLTGKSRPQRAGMTWPREFPIPQPAPPPPRVAEPPPELPSPAFPMAVARQFIEQAHIFEDGTPTLRHWRGGWWIWRMSFWEETDERALRALLYAFTENAIYLDDKGDGKPWAPNRKRISDLADALAAICILPANLDQPCWLDDRETGIIVATANGLLDIEQQQLYPHSPLFFNQTAVPFDYDPAASSPARWFAFLEKLWPGDPAAIKTLGEWYGYVISGRLDLHKIFMTVGPTRGGKGIIARILIALVGRQNTCGPTLNSLGGEFGLAPFIGKPLGVISDARFVGKNGNVVVERLLSISGEDTLTVNRKYREQWTGKLPTRLHVVSNELPRLGDASSAVIGRIVLLVLTKSWLGREDHSLEAGLREELTGILNWALEGLYRLTVTNRNAFTRTSSADDAIVTMRDMASPVAAFVREKCELGSEYQITRDALYSAFKAWCEAAGHPRPTKEILGRDLRAAFTSIRTARPRVEDEGEGRPYSYAGIRLRPASGGNIAGPLRPPRPEEGPDDLGLGGLGGPAMYSPRDTDGGAPLGRCAKCNGIVADAPLDEALGVYLHEQCRKFWLRDHSKGGR